MEHGTSERVNTTKSPQGAAGGRKGSKGHKGFLLLSLVCVWRALSGDQVLGRNLGSRGPQID